MGQRVLDGNHRFGNHQPDQTSRDLRSGQASSLAIIVVYRGDFDDVSSNNIETSQAV